MGWIGNRVEFTGDLPNCFHVAAVFPHAGKRGLKTNTVGSFAHLHEEISPKHGMVSARLNTWHA